jgi:DNA repair exonuclease SbcCD nuclease subunit
MLSFLHAADLHLGLRLTRLPPEVARKVREARFQALEKVRDAARQHRVDFLLIAGDLFDDHAVDGDIARRTFDLLESFPAPVFVLSGNHDPLLAGSVWDRPPWHMPAPRRVRVLREPRPVEALPGVVLFPCPVFRKTSLNDPTAWIAGAPADGSAVRIGIAHGSLKVRDDLPADDHLIARHAAHDLRLDYLALGHWHGRQLFRDRAGVERTAYPGVHEPFRFPGSAESRTGWLPYTSGLRDEFLDSGRGEVLLVRIAGPEAPPVVEPLDIGHLIWEEERCAIDGQESLDRLIDQVATRPSAERRLLRLRLDGVIGAEEMARLSQLREVLDRYLWGDLDSTGVHLTPTDEEVRAMAGQGVLRRVLEQLQEEAQGTEPAARLVAERATVLLYQIARETTA